MGYQPAPLTDAQIDRAGENEDYRRSLEAREAQNQAVYDAFQVISKNLNSGGGRDFSGLHQALRSEHSTLLGMLANEVLAEVDRRKGDGRLCNFHTTIGEYAARGSSVSSLRVSEIRQALI